MLKVALTGGIATGKTYVLDRLRRLGVPVIDADRLAHGALEVGNPAAGAVAESFGPSVVAPGGAIDRRRLGAIVFEDPAARARLEAIIHPVVYQAVEAWFEAREAERVHPFGVADIPLLYETGHESAFDRVVTTVCDSERQVARIMSRDRLSAAEARKRVAAQWPAAEKARRADFVIHTDGASEDTDRQVDEVVRALRAIAP